MTDTMISADPILRAEDVEFLTDRFGYADVVDQAEVPQALLDAMWDEVSFVARRGGRLGLLIETEHYHPDGDDADEDVQQGWGTTDKVEIERRLVAAASKFQARFPQAEVYVSVNPQMCMGRAGMRAFVPEAACSQELTRRIGEAFLSYAYGPVEG